MGRAALSTSAIVALWIAGCSSGPVAVGPRPPMAPTLLGTATGSSCGLLLFNAFPIAVNDRLQSAQDDARAALGSRQVEVVDVKIRERWSFVPLVGTVLCTDVEETAVQ